MNFVFENFLPASSTVRQCSNLLNQLQAKKDIKKTFGRIVRMNPNHYKTWIKIKKQHGELEVVISGKTAISSFTEAIHLASRSNNEFESLIIN